ncbi:Uncharacterised protein [Nocardia otitidiscaviarum]|uniref:DUF385 domain-containing protein n=1 Tax=Nocardia otitidiscaviarum TaxID=1823 RepID=A0A379JN30_9NOCA|nr:hypothetical protein [Nocardia otitidiscaviarum]SUD49423.1 Uncharacterised protein [Nocardia otitidiscaviarum]
MTTKYETSGVGSSAVLMALRFPMGLGHTVAELRYLGRRSGRRIALPVSYARSGDTVIVRVGNAAAKNWWRNFRTPHSVSIRIDGDWLAGIGRLVAPGTIEHEEVEAVYLHEHPRQRTTATDPYLVIELARTQPNHTSRWRQWFTTVTAGEFLGFVAPAVAGALLLDTAPALVVAGLLLAAVVEGAVLGSFQSLVLRKWLRDFATGRWVRATVVGAVVAWTIGTVPVLYGDRITDWPPAVQAPVIAVGALVMVFAIGVAQWFVLRERTERAALWIWANAVGWIAGLAAFALITTPLWQPGQPTALIVGIGLLGGLAMAAAMAAVTGAFGVRMLDTRNLVSPH